MFGRRDSKKTDENQAPVTEASTGPAADGPGATGLGGDTKIKDWLSHPQGGPVLREMLAQAGSDESQLKPVRNFAMKRLIPMSKGQFTEEKIAQLVVKAEAYDPSTAPAEPAPASAAPDSGEDDELELPDFAEVITEGRFAGRTVIVTGAGSGIGRATASRIAREGGRVIAADIDGSRLDALAAELEGVDLVTVVADITRQEDVDALVAAAGERIDGLANVAGIMDNMTPLHEVSDEVWDRVMAVNATGMFKLSRAVLPVMLEAHAGSIVNITSEAGLRGSAAGLAYTASKHAVVGLTKSSAFMYGPQGIRVNAVAPGPVITGIEASFDSDLGGRRIRTAMAAMPGPVGPESLAASITFLLSDDAHNVNGAILPSDGGWSAV
ncbi:SDR family NAD(P)-dependent oxidoreductase [Demequina muriae]|uniref:SDR family oxidoreductase n=1 Tax=Demequina muriae TaxID=3051664 RepID=A0ABT8GIR5_9MICO|nr:SDR family oxidoreductase [Demequina sp. EGI L300058]MDN4481161.1 SDR family oxidoreductase [Demequina sp. EGI L300058]